jgi:hypothetical protein
MTHCLPLKGFLSLENGFRTEPESRVLSYVTLFMVKST